MATQLTFDKHDSFHGEVLRGAVGATVAQDDETVVGVSWNNFQEERWGLWDEPAIQAALEAARVHMLKN